MNNHWLNQSIDQLVNKSINQLIDQSINQSFIQSSINIEKSIKKKKPNTVFIWTLKYHHNLHGYSLIYVLHDVFLCPQSLHFLHFLVSDGKSILIRVLIQLALDSFQCLHNRKQLHWIDTIICVHLALMEESPMGEQ